MGNSLKCWSGRCARSTPRMRRCCAYFSDLEELGQVHELEKQEDTYHNQSTVPDRNCCVLARKTENTRVLL